MATTRRTPSVTAASINKVMFMKFPGAASGELPVSVRVRNVTVDSVDDDVDDIDEV